MKLVLQRRAEIALRSLGSVEQSHITRALDELRSATPSTLLRNPNLHRLVGASDQMYAYRGSPQMRLLLSLQGDTCVVEDIVTHDRLSRLPLTQAQ